MSFFQHPAALVESSQIGEGTRVWAFAHVLPGARIGRNCNICDHTFIENDVVIGDRVTVKSGVQLWDGISVEDDVFIGPNATFTNDRFPRSRQHQEQGILRTVIRRGASIGANATVLPGLTIGEFAMVGAGTVVTRDVPPNSVLAGNPGRITGYTGVSGAPIDSVRVTAPPETGSRPSGIEGVTIHRMPLVEDLRGLLSYGEMQVHVPFEVKRYFLVFGVSSQEIRGEHAHKQLRQFFICVHGSCHLVADDGARREEFILNSPSIGIHLPPMVWGVQYMYSPDAVLMVLASDRYDPDDYIRNYSEFLRLKQAEPAPA
jgi:acetyltransferase-like isoleucine patch superfamily enzyme/dTDP-4-dehydrorhamnose 3,5-epimerase-like enzyme